MTTPNFVYIGLIKTGNSQLLPVLISPM
jgi:hypothetical protein